MFQTNSSKISGVAHSRMHLIVAVVILFLIPTLILIGIIPFAWRMFILPVVAFFFAIAAFLQGFSLADLGVRTDNLKQSVLLQLPIILVFLLMLGLAPKLGLAGRKFVPNPTFFIFYIFISSPCQEYIYRSYLHAISKRSRINSLVLILILSIPYCYVHIIYRDVITLLFTIIIGLAWAITYIKHNNLIAVSLSHAILGYVTLSLGLI